MKWMLIAYCLSGGPNCTPTPDVSVFQFQTEALCAARAGEITAEGGQVGVCTDACVGQTPIEISACRAPANSCGPMAVLEPGGRWCVADISKVTEALGPGK